MLAQDSIDLHDQVLETQKNGRPNNHIDRSNLLVGMKCSYRGQPFALESFLYEVPGTRQNIVENNICYEVYDLRYCLLDDATHVKGYGLDIVHAPIDQILTYGMIGWSESDLSTAQDGALTLGSQGSHAITMRKRLGCI